MLFRIDTRTAQWARVMLARHINHLQHDLWTLISTRPLDRVGVENLKRRKAATTRAIANVKTGFIDQSALSILRQAASWNFQVAETRSKRRLIAKRIINLKKCVAATLAFRRIDVAFTSITKLPKQ